MLNGQNAICWHEHTPRDVCATHPLRHQWYFMPSHARPLSDAAEVHKRRELNLLSVTSVSMHASTPKENIFAFNVKYTYSEVYVVNFLNNKAKQNFAIFDIIFYTR